MAASEGLRMTVAVPIATLRAMVARLSGERATGDRSWFERDGPGFIVRPEPEHRPEPQNQSTAFSLLVEMGGGEKFRSNHTCTRLLRLSTRTL